MNWLVQIDPNVNKRDTDWICVCDVCQHERIVTYAQSWNLKKGNSKRTCRDCQYELGLIPIYQEGLRLGRKFNNAKRDKTNCSIANQLRALFAPETVTNKEMRRKQSLAKLNRFGNLANNWQGGKSKENKLLRSRFEYKELRRSIFQRDNYTCQICKVRGGHLNMDHIKEWCNYPELRFDPNNCRTLCIECHRKTPNYGSKAVKRSV